ncbi:MAG: type IV toxin-antitoxin system AbiEi family antitoxin domain-containing protein [Actinomycetota bacterium]|nr:type IV toxin-antitoxin system AbiEi family antitoxin domain-containing protein [Actinomycetota bacterium]
MDWTAAADAHGIIDLSDLYDAGLDVHDVRGLVNRGELTRLARGWCSVGTPGNPEERHRLATRAMLRSHGGRAVASYHSALLLLDLPTYAADLSTVRLTRRTSGAPRTRRGLSLGRAASPDLIVGETVHPALAVVQVGTCSGPVSALVAADGALHQGAMTRNDLDDLLLRMGRTPGVRGLGPVLQRADGRHASPGETRTGEMLHRMGLSATPQFEISGGGFRAFADFALEEEGVVVEFDGMMKYGRTADPVDFFGRMVAPGEVVALEKVREDRIRDLEWEVVRVTWEDLARPQRVTARIREAIARAQRRRAVGHAASSPHPA